jgi:pimeloyl-ACP methyl ester carboxylesterase
LNRSICVHLRLSAVSFLLFLLCVLPNFGCWYSAKYSTPQRASQGYVIVLPGIEGASPLNASVAAGLVDAGVPSEIEVYDWTLSCVAFAANLRFYWRNEQEALKIANKIVAYQNLHPGRPVHLIGHSGGGGIAIMTLERLPANYRIASALLLAPAVAPDYDLRRAMMHTQHGIWNYYSPYDVGFLAAGTLIMGTIEGKHTRAAGQTPFVLPATFDVEDRRLYTAKLHQQPYTRDMAEYGHYGGHAGWASRPFVQNWIAPVLLSQIQPPPAVQSGYARDERWNVR